VSLSVDSTAWFTAILLAASTPAASAGMGPGHAPDRIEQRAGDECDDACWLRALTQYAADPSRQLRRFLALGRSASSDLPPVVLLALAEAHLRAAQPRAAEGLFREALARDLGDPWQGWASLGIAWSAITRREHGLARSVLEPLVVRGSEGATLGGYLLAMLDALDGRPRAAAERFSAIRDDDATSPELRQAAALGVAYAMYWDGDDVRASTAFDVIATSGPASLRDDARYGAALARLRSGDTPRALTELAALAGETAANVAISRALLELEPRALLVRGARIHRTTRLTAPEKKVFELLDGAGASMARALLRRLERTTTNDDTSARDTAGAAGDDPAHTGIDPSTGITMRPPRVAPPISPNTTQGTWHETGVAAALVALSWLSWRLGTHARRRRRTT
jgi:hypothetical protein